ncbi:hypothetical protein [Oribacterium sp. FC2011]|uniref:hypothetical protein n=1 Tax=Oribacterium sp. FC2011 TaxID=1408311 RepID=UPI0004E27D0F|nr:hypothetical protein [Oribacterium sp. FC2011]
MSDFSEIHKKWLNMWHHKEEYAFGETDVDLDSFKELVKDTYYLFKEMHGHIEENDYSDITPAEMRDYLDILSCISMYSASCCTDESKDHAFAITRLLSFDLADLGANYSLYANDEDEPLVEGIISSMEAYNYGLEKVIHYDVNKGDLSDYMEFASVVRC